MASIPVYPQLKVGRGVDPETGKEFATGIKFDAPVKGNAQQTLFSLDIIKTSSELSQSLGISATASVTAGLFGLTGEFRLTNTRQINTYYTYGLVRAEVRNAPELLQNPQLEDHAAQLLVNHGWGEFAKVYGWEYVEGYISGASYYALIEVQTSNAKEQQAVSAALSGNYGMIAAGGDFASKVRTSASTAIIRVFVAQGGGNSDVTEITLEEMIEQARTISKIATDTPVPIILLTTGYRQLPGLPSVPPENSLPRINQRNTLNDLGRTYLRLRDYKGNVEYVLDHLADVDEFRELTPDERRQKRDDYRKSLTEVVEEIEKIVQQAKMCSEDIAQCQGYTPGVNLLPIPTIGGQLMNLKQMEDTLMTLRQQMDALISPRGISVNGAELLLGLADGRDKGTLKENRALVHFVNDELQINYDGDFEGGVVVSGPSLQVRGELLAHGEIKGKLWYSDEFVWVSNGPHVRMHHSNNSLAVLTHISGEFAGGGEQAFVYVGGDGHWYLGGQTLVKNPMSAITVKARCIGKP
jgi:hypothetical protein